MPSRPHNGAQDSRFNRRLTEILAHATEVFCDKSYQGASMRDLSRATAMSLAGLYHYFGSKERLLYLIQKHTFTTILEELKRRLKTTTDPAVRIRIFIQNHLEYFVANQSGLKVLAHEDDALKNGFNHEISAIKREYYKICLGLMEDLKRARKLNFNSRTAVMSLFGMINWIYTWYNPRHDGTAKQLADEMSEIILSGVGSNSMCGAGIPARVKPGAGIRARVKPGAGISARVKPGAGISARVKQRLSRAPSGPSGSHAIKPLSSRAGISI